MMVESNQPLVESKRLDIVANTWKQILKLDVDADKKIYVREITIEVNDTTTFQPHIKIDFNGAPLLRDFQPVSTTTKLSFGGDLVLDDKVDKPLEISAKSDGTNTLKITAIITGVKVQRKG